MKKIVAKTMESKTATLRGSRNIDSERGIFKEKHTWNSRTSRNVTSAWHWDVISRTTFARITAEFEVTWTFCFAHFILCNTLIIEITITFDIRMNTITFIDT